MKLRLFSLFLLCFCLFQASAQFQESPQFVTTAHAKETIFGPEDPTAKNPFPQGIYYSYEVTVVEDTAFTVYEQDFEKPYKYAIAALIVPCIHCDQFYVRFQGCAEMLDVTYMGILSNTAGDFHTWSYNSQEYSSGMIFIGVMGGTVNMVGGGKFYRFNSLISPQD